MIKFETGDLDIRELRRIDRSLIRAAHPEIGIEPGDRKLSKEEIVAMANATESKKKPFMPTAQWVIDTVRGLMRDVRDVYGVDFRDSIAAGLVPGSKYLPVALKFFSEADNRIGFLRTKPPILLNTQLFNYHGKLLIPDRKDLGNLVPWDEQELKLSLLCRVNYAMFRQIRGEWKEGFADALRVLGEQGLENTKDLEIALSQRASEIITLKKRPELGAILFQDRLSFTPEIYSAYVSALQLSKRMNLGRVALADDFILYDDGNTYVMFRDDNHLSTDRKKRFLGSKN